MKIRAHGVEMVTDCDDPLGMRAVEVKCLEADLEGVYCGIGIITDQGVFGICQRDNGIEVMLDGNAVWDSHRLRGGSMEANEAKPTVDEIEETLRRR